MWRELQADDPGQVGPYRLRGLLGSGGMGRVFLGVTPGGRLAAVKVIRADLAADAEFLARFRREVSVARKVSGPFTAPVIDAGLDGPMPWLATAYVAGPSLADAVRDHGPLPAASVLAEAGAALPAAGWLPEPVTRTFLQVAAPAGGVPTVTSLAPASPAPAAARARHEDGGDGRPRRRRRPLAVAAVAAVILAASAVGGMTLTANAHHLPAPHAGHTGHAHMTMHAPRRTGQPTATPTAIKPTGTTPAVTQTPAAAPTATATPTVTVAPTMMAPAATATPTATVTPAATETVSVAPAVTPTAAASPTAS